MHKVALTVNTFQTPDGNPVALGNLTFRLVIDGSVNNEQIQSNKVVIPLNSSGVITGSPTFWANADIAPPGTYYIQSVYTAAGQLVSGPNLVTVSEF
jgi:hypothetical protein